MPSKRAGHQTIERSSSGDSCAFRTCDVALTAQNTPTERRPRVARWMRSQVAAGSVAVDRMLLSEQLGLVPAGTA
jgi:hypothetical protein